MMHVGEQVGKNLSVSVENPNVLNIPRCTHDIPPMYSWYPSDVLNILYVLMISPDVLMMSPRCTYDVSQMYSWYPLDVLMVSLRCTEHPRCTHDILRCTHDVPRCTHEIPDVLMISPDVLMISPRCTHGIPRCTEHTLHSVVK